MRQLRIPRRRSSRRWGWPALLVLGMAGLRALVPAGFMLAPVDGRIAVVLCEPGLMTGMGAMPDMAGMPDMAALAGGHAHDHHHHPGHDPVPHDRGAGDNADCPYAQSGGSAPLPSIPLWVGAVVAQRFASSLAVTQTALTSGPPRQPSSRGPPLA